MSLPWGWETISAGFSLSSLFRNRIGLSFWAYLLPSFYFLPALCFPLSSLGLGNLSFYFAALHFFLLSVFFGGVPFFSFKKAFASPPPLLFQHNNRGNRMRLLIY